MQAHQTGGRCAGMGEVVERVTPQMEHQESACYRDQKERQAEDGVGDGVHG